MFYFYTFLIIGIFYFFGDVIFSFGDIIPGSVIDSKLLNYILEHIFLFVTGTDSIHSSLWNLPFFYPIQNTLAFSDTLLSFAPFYILFRLFYGYHISYSLTVISFCVLNYTLFYFILRKINYSKLLSSFGAFLYAFSYVNKVSLFHTQTLIQFFYLAMFLILMWFSLLNKSYFIGGYSGIVEGSDIKNTHREYLKNLPDYCILKRPILSSE